MAMRAGRALRDKWADEARYAADPDYYRRHGAAHDARGRVIRRYAALLIAHHVPEDALRLLIAAQDRVRVVEADRQFRVTARPRSRGADCPDSGGYPPRIPAFGMYSAGGGV